MAVGIAIGWRRPGLPLDTDGYPSARGPDLVARQATEPISRSLTDERQYVDRWAVVEVVIVAGGKASWSTLRDLGGRAIRQQEGSVPERAWPDSRTPKYRSRNQGRNWRRSTTADSALCPGAGICEAAPPYRPRGPEANPGCRVVADANWAPPTFRFAFLQPESRARHPWGTNPLEATFRDPPEWTIECDRSPVVESKAC
jgi:hypothetical protein